MIRREFITLLGGAAAWPVVARAQQPAMPVIGFLDPRSPGTITERIRCVAPGLGGGRLRRRQERGDRIPLGREPNRSATGAGSRSGQPPGSRDRHRRRHVAAAVKAATTTVPIIFLASEDPVRLGLVASLARPGGNATGINFLATELTAKRLELLSELVPAATRVAVLVNPANASNTESTMRDAEAAARAIGCKFRSSRQHRPRDRCRFRHFRARASGRPLRQHRHVLHQPARPTGPLGIVPQDSGDLRTARLRRAGGLMSYGSDITDAWRQAGVYVGRILKGAKPSDLPVLQASKFELVVNHQTAGCSASKFHQLCSPAPMRSSSETPCVHHAARRRGGVAARGAGAAGRADATDRRAHGAAASDPQSSRRLTAFMQGLQDFGWTDGRNVRIDTRWQPSTDADHFRKSAAELVALAPEVILAIGSTTLGPLRQTTRTVPIVFALVADPVGGGFVESLARPGGNATGFTLFEYSLSGKWLQLLKEIAPRMTRAAFLRDSASPSGIGQFAALQSVGPSLGVEVTPINVRDADEIERSVTAFAHSSNGGLIVTSTSVATRSSRADHRAAARHKLPTIYWDRFYVTAGGLISYGADASTNAGERPVYVDRILKGEKPADLPVQAPTKYELVDQPQDCQGARPRRAAVPARPRRRGDRMRSAASSSRCSAARRRRGRSRRVRSSRRCR